MLITITIIPIFSSCACVRAVCTCVRAICACVRAVCAYVRAVRAALVPKKCMCNTRQTRDSEDTDTDSHRQRYRQRSTNRKTARLNLAQAQTTNLQRQAVGGAGRTAPQTGPGKKSAKSDAKTAKHPTMAKLTGATAAQIDKHPKPCLLHFLRILWVT